jgi:hypothetical protein
MINESAVVREKQIGEIMELLEAVVQEADELAKRISTDLNDYTFPARQPIKGEEKELKTFVPALQSIRIRLMAIKESHKQIASVLNRLEI